MRTSVFDRELDVQKRDHADDDQLIVPDLVTLLAHPEYDGSKTTIERMAPDIEAYLSRVLVEPTSSRIAMVVNRTGAFLAHRLWRRQKPIVCACGRVLLKHGVCRTCFERELEILRKMRPEMEAAVKVVHQSRYDNQIQAHLSAYCAMIPTALHQAVEEALKIWVADVLGVHIQIWGSDIPSQGFHYETLKITNVAVPSKILEFVDKLTTLNDKLPRRSAELRVYIKGVDPYLGAPFDIGVLCGVRNAIVVAVHQWE